MLAAAARCAARATTRTLSTEAAPITATVTNGVADVVLNRPSKLNALNYEMIQLMTPLYEQLDADPSVHAIVLHGAGDKAFCAGGDVVSIVESIAEDGDLHRRFFRDEYRLDYAIAALDTPHIAVYNGIAMGGGIGVSVHGQARVATPGSLFAMPETAIGLFPDVGGSHFLPRLPHGLGMYLALTGARVKGMDLVAYGIATHGIDAPDAADAVLRAAQDAGSADAVAHALDSVAHSSIASMDEGARVAAIEASLGGVPVSVLDDTFGSAASYPELLDSLASVEAAAADASVSKWAAKTLATLDRMSPTSLLVTFEQIKRGKHLDLAQCLAMEARLVWRVAADHDFSAGVNALLINKESVEPADLWSPNSVDAVPDHVVQAYFAPWEDPERELHVAPNVDIAAIDSLPSNL